MKTQDEKVDELISEVKSLLKFLHSYGRIKHGKGTEYVALVGNVMNKLSHLSKDSDFTLKIK